MIKKVLSIAGSDSSGGAGIQADIKTITVHKMYAMSVITALTAQNTMGVSGISEVSPEFVGSQIDAVFTDIFPDSVKIGMVSSAEIINVISEKLKAYRARNIVVDPVMVSTSGHRLISSDAQEFLKNKLMPIATVITPNIPEAEFLTGMKISDEKNMMKAAGILSEKYEAAILIKGGHLICDANDFLVINGKKMWFTSKKINNPNTHGTGCTLSSAIACNLANGNTIEESIKNAKTYLTGAIESMLDIGKGAGPLNHCYNI